MIGLIFFLESNHIIDEISRLLLIDIDYIIKYNFLSDNKY